MGSALAAVDLGGNTAQDVAAGQSHTCVVLTSGDIACFGYNYYGQVRQHVHHVDSTIGEPREANMTTLVLLDEGSTHRR